MTDLFIAKILSAGAPRPLVTVRAASAAEALLFLAARYPEDTIEAVTEPGDWASDADTGSASGDIREHPDAVWQPPSGGAG